VKLIIVRGPDGSGKADLVKQLGGKLRSNYWHTGLYWYELGNGHYRFDKNKLEESILWCVSRFRTAMNRGLSPIFSSSSEPRRNKEYPIYLDLAKEFGYEVSIVRTDGPWYAENLHPEIFVPGRILRKQINDYEQFEEELEAKMLDLSTRNVSPAGTRTSSRSWDETSRGMAG
jgi:predicted kinase